MQAMVLEYFLIAVLVVLLFCTGLMLKFAYQASPDKAYNSIVYLINHAGEELADSGVIPDLTLGAGLRRFNTTRNIQDVSASSNTIFESEAERLESELSMIRYISWAIPSIGFIGTVRGIGDALGQAYKAVEGDISGVTVSLGVAFNSTFVALVLSIIIMFALHQLQLSQERLVLDCQRYADRRLMRHLVAH